MEQKNMRSLVTPEGVDLQLRLADTGARVAAFMVDLIIMILLMIGLSISLLMVAARIGGDSKDLVFVVWILGFFVIRNFYFMIFEMGPKAATPGKRLQKIRVASRNGGPLTASAVFARNAMRELEFFLPLGLLFGGGSGVDAWMHLLALVWSVIFLFFPLFNKDHLRMGDIIAGTIVVKSPKPKLSKDLSIETASDHQYIFSPAQINAYGVKELHVLENVLRNNHAKTLEQVSERIMKKIEWPDQQSYINDPKAQREFLNAYYKALRAKLESGLLFGVRRKDKFDKTDV
ncbi:MAG TPA: RDD family protein [Hellea balneolensis]|uniref:RDD family protein n=1 Tax=Hellea balneolensis TaxID=287478 RepID=A0A7C5QR89_9PROT|nr:RDD family protein [Hellea balneolensis]